MTGPVAVSVVAVLAIVVLAVLALAAMRRHLGSGSVGEGRRDEMLAALYQARNELRASESDDGEEPPQ